MKITLITFLKETNIKIIDNFLKKGDLDKLNSLSLPLIGEMKLKYFTTALIKIIKLKIPVFHMML